MNIGGVIIDFIDHQFKMGGDRVCISSHEFSNIKLHGLDKYGVLHNTSSYEREWRRLREKELLTGVSIEEEDNNSREKTWIIRPLQK